MKDFKVSNNGTGRVFSSNFLERLTRTHFSFPVILYLLLSGVCLVFAVLNYSISIFSYLWLFPAGMIFFTLIEYLIHRFIFHFNASTPSELELQYQVHGIHHEFPRDKDRLVMPPVFSILIAGFFYFIFILLFNDYGVILFAGFSTGYSTYLLIHYAVHAMKPPKNIFKYLWKHHSMHHYSSVESAFSVSFPFWDYLFGTMPMENNSKKS